MATSANKQAPRKRHSAPRFTLEQRAEMTRKARERRSRAKTVRLGIAAEALGIGTTAAHRLVRNTGQLTDGVPAIRLGGVFVVSRAALERVLGAPLDD